MTRRRKQNNGINTDTITVEIVRAAHFKRITHQKLTDFEKNITEKYDFDDNKIIPRVKYEPMSREENIERQKKGLPPRVLKQNPRCP